MTPLAARAALTHREGDLRAFLEVTDAVYDPASPYVAPFRPDLRRFLDTRANPLFAEHGYGTFYTAHRGGRPVGRIVAHVHRASNARHGERRAAFGYFDVADDLEAARLLLDLAADHARRAGCDALAGNFNLTAMQQCGVLTEGFDRAPYTDQHYNPPHVPALLEACGFRRTFPMTTFELDLRGFDPEAHCPPAARERLADPALRWATLRAADFPGVLEDVRVVLNDGFDRNPMFVPLTPAEMHFQAKDMARILDPRIAALVRDAEGPVGTVVCVPDLNPFLRATRSRVSLATPLHYLRHRLRRRRAVIVFYSVARRWQGRGVNGAMLYRVTRALVDAGYESLGITWIGDDNAASLRQMARLGARPHHRLHLFERAVMPEAQPPAAPSPVARAAAAEEAQPARALGLSDAAWGAVLREAALAPSVHNVQPGRVAAAPDGRVWLARAVDRALPVGDPTFDDVLVSVGALAEGLAIALAPHGLGLAPLAPVAPDAAGAIDADGERCAVVATTRLLTLAGGAALDPLAGAVGARRCHRGAFRPLRDAPEESARVLLLSEHPDWVVRTDRDVLALAGGLVDRATLDFMANPGYRRELYAWLRLSPRHPAWHQDGLRADCLGLSRLEAAAAAVLLRPAVFGALHRLGLAGPLVSEAAATRSAAALLGFAPPANLGPLEVGRRLYRAWLTATAAGFALAPMSALTDQPETCTAIAEALGVPEGRRLRLVFRAGPMPEPAPPRSARLSAPRLLVPVPRDG